jgi:hypothetical protein
MTRDPRATAMTEAELMENIRALVSDLGLHAYHAHDARRSWGPGFPDLVVVGRGGCIWRECKTEAGSVTPEQRRWGDALQASGQRWAAWRPRHLLSGQIARELAEVAAIQLALFGATTTTGGKRP